MSGRHSLRAFAQAEERPEPERQAPEDASTDEVTTGADETAAVDDAETDAETETEAEAEIEAEAGEDDREDKPEEPDAEPARTIAWPRVLVFAVIPAVALLLAAGSAFLRWQLTWDAGSDTARTESVDAAKEITVEMLSYDPETVEQHLNEALGRLTGNFLDSYTTLVNTRVIPIATTQRVTATAEVPAAGVVSASPDRAEVVLYLNQYVTVGDQAPQKTASTVRATMVREDGKWLMSEFAPVKP
ncbi:hypothetical protein [Mycolicibacterium goodii]|uniref:hypothetical protein n=1 Tax=Mycolicibacterium goodii TaxID=134601 RepID=UPI000C25946F|nr:hypothetical protein [Mycolicibacterium goodii]PJK20665.1 hypothetical protein CSX11_19795 [Mycolicibacterium goodii]